MLIALIAIATCSFDQAWIRAKTNAYTWTVCDHAACKFKDLERLKASLIPTHQLIHYLTTIHSLQEETVSGYTDDNYDPKKRR